MPRIGMLLKKKKGFETLVRECSGYLASGSYHVTKCYNKLALKKGRLEPGNLKNWYFQAIFGTFHVENRLGYANCDRALLSVVKNYKMFDERGGRVYTKFTERFWAHAVMFYDCMANALPSTILSVDRDRRVVVERFISETARKDREKCFRAFSGAYLAYMDGAKIERVARVSQATADMKREALPPDIREAVKTLEARIGEDSTEYPFIVCHNDVNTNNLLTQDNQSFFLTDFELCGVNVFFFDVLGMILNSAAFQKDDSLLEPYFAGAFDGELSALFEKAGLTFHASEKVRYAYLFLYFKICLIQQAMPELLPAYSERLTRFISLLDQRQ